MLKNYMEDVVIDLINDVWMNGAPICKCEKCKNDVINLTLNRLPPKYCSSLTGEMWTRLAFLEGQNIADVLAVIAESINIVNKNQRHD